MNGFEYDKDDPYSMVSVKALRIGLRTRLSDLQPTMQQKMEAFLKREIGGGQTTDGNLPFDHICLRTCHDAYDDRLEYDQNVSHGYPTDCQN